ncbi:hypothetical protein Tco_1307212, partial [Tanacetum coccineum]
KVLKTSKQRRSVSKLGRRTVKSSSKGAPSVPTNTEWNAIDMEIDETMDYTLAQDMESAEKKASSEGTAKYESTDKQNKGTDKPSEGIDKAKISTDRQGEGTADQDEGKSNKEKLKEKEKRVEIRNVEETERPRPTSTRLILTLRPLPKIDPKDKGKKMIEEEDESDTESEGITEAEKKFKQLANDEEVARKVQEEWEAKEEKKRLDEEEATESHSHSFKVVNPSTTQSTRIKINNIGAF